MPAPGVDLAALDCFGFGDDLPALIDAVLPRVERLSLSGEDEVFAWTDETSGARLVLGCHGVDVRWLWPTLWSPPSTLLGGLTVLGNGLVSARVVDGAGGRLAHVLLRLEQGANLTEEMLTRTWPAAVVAGGPVQVFPDADAFLADPSSIRGDPASYPTQPPEHFVARGWPWPPRLSEESLEEPREAAGHTRMTGTVLAADLRRNSLTGRHFTVLRVRTLGLELDVCVPGDRQAVAVGSVVAGLVDLVGRLGAEPGDPRQRWVQRTG